MLYTDSAVNLDAATGKLRWYYQAVPDDFEDHDLQSSPISAVIGGVPVILAAGKVGYVYALNARSGALLWKTPVGEHNGHDDDSVLALSHKLKIKYPYMMLPGPAGGVLSNLAAAGGSVYVATNDAAAIATGPNTADGNKKDGGAPPRHRSRVAAATRNWWPTRFRNDKGTHSELGSRQQPTSPARSGRGTTPEQATQPAKILMKIARLSGRSGRFALEEDRIVW